MHEQDLAIVKALVPVAWADGVFAEPERQMLDALLEAYCATAMMCEHVAARLRTEDGVDHALLETYDRMTRSLADLAKVLCLLPEDERTDA